MPESHPTGVGTHPPTRKCPTCGTHLDRAGAGGDAVLECPNCGLVMFDALPTRP